VRISLAPATSQACRCRRLTFRRLQGLVRQRQLRRASANGCEREYAPQSDRRTNGPDNHPSNLRHFSRRRAHNARPRQDAARQIDKQEADKERSVSDRAGKNKHA
jgi:hypothetical protein